MEEGEHQPMTLVEWGNGYEESFQGILFPNSLTSEEIGQYISGVESSRGELRRRRRRRR